MANALQLKPQRARNHGTTTKSGASEAPQARQTERSIVSSSVTSAFAAAFSLGSLSFTSRYIKPAKLTLTPHHLYYLLSRFEELGVDIGPMNVRLESLHAEQSPGNYVSFLSQQPKSNRGDRESIHSVSSFQSVLSNLTMSSFWWGFASRERAAKSEKAKAQLQTDLKYLYSAFTMIPCLRLSPDRRARLISGYEEFPLDSAVPIIAFHNVSVLELCDLDFRQFFGWDKMADQLRSLTVKRGHLDDPLDLIVHIVLDDLEKRRRRSSKPQSPPTPVWPASPSGRQSEFVKMNSAPGTPEGSYLGACLSPRSTGYSRGDVDASTGRPPRNKSASPTRSTGPRQAFSHRYMKSSGDKIKRSGSGSSNSSTHSLGGGSRRRSSSNLLSISILPASKWRFLRHLSLADNSLTSLSSPGFSPLSNTLHSLDLSSNLFTEVPDCLATLVALRALNLSNCMIGSLHSVARSPLPAITALNLRSNRLTSIAGIERLLSLERIDFRDNKMTDPTEMARLTGIPDIREIWVAGNPFVRSHRDYRPVIFNLFRAAPGYTEDIIIDTREPSSSERRQLRERIAESAAVPVMRAADTNIDEASNSKVSRIPGSVISYVAVGERPLPHSTQSEAVIGSNRRKKGPRRRLVDLSIEDNLTSEDYRSPNEIPVASTFDPHCQKAYQ